MSEEATREDRVVGEEPTRVRRAPRRSWVGLALATACGFLMGLLVVTTFGGAEEPRTTTQRITVPGPPAASSDATVITRTLVPRMVGEPLDIAKERAERSKFVITVDAGGGVFGVIRDENWEVVAQRPRPGELFEQGSTIHVDIVKR